MIISPGSYLELDFARGLYMEYTFDILMIGYLIHFGVSRYGVYNSLSKCNMFSSRLAALTFRDNQ